MSQAARKMLGNDWLGLAHALTLRPERWGLWLAALWNLLDRRAAILPGKRGALPERGQAARQAQTTNTPHTLELHMLAQDFGGKFLMIF